MERYTTVGQVRALLCSSYRRTRIRRSFTSVLREIEEASLTDSHAFFLPKKTTELLSLAELNTLVDRLPISLNRILTSTTEPLIAEDAVILPGRDIHGFVHLPFVDDGMHSHNHFEINYVYHGAARQTVAQEERTLQTGDLCLIAPDMPHSVLVDDEGSIVLSFMVRRSTFDAIFGNLLLQDDLLAIFFRNTLSRSGHSKYLTFHIADDDAVVLKLMQDLIIESNTARSYAPMYANCLLQQLFYSLLRDYGSTIHYYGLEKQLSDERNFSTVLCYLQNNYRTATLAGTAAFFGYSEGYLSRLFKQNMNMNFTAVMQSLKLRKGKDYLLGTDCTLTEICERIGYESADYFTKCFKRHFGCTPSEFRRTAARSL